ncbi:hypothetical protein PENSPDRAFT_656209 [Peniophora sp. CONT]|nr:hypothetical protein PENSPDRAFT_656209 [Peniophora sp. CONT]
MDLEPPPPSEQPARHSPIQRLPPELLLDVISMLVLDWAPDVFTSHSIERLGWITVTHICRKWRELCLAASVLWTHWIGRLPEGLPDILSRAGNELPLHLDVYLDLEQLYQLSPPQNVTWFARIWDALPPFERVRTMNWVFPNYVDTLMRNLCHPPTALNQLEHLVLNNTHDFPKLHQLTFRAPALRTLHLTLACFERIQAPMLTDLSLTMHSYSMVLDTSTVHNLLLECPMLETLRLTDCHFRPFDRHPSRATQQQVLSLTHLKYLMLEDSVLEDETRYDDIFLLFTHALPLPPWTSVDIISRTKSRLDDPNEDMATKSLTFCLSSFAQVEQPNTLCLSTSSISLLVLQDTGTTSAFTSHRATGGLTRSASTFLDDAIKSTSVQVDWIPSINLISRFLSLVSARFESCLNGITVLSLEPQFANEDDYRVVIANVLQHLPSLHSIRLACTDSMAWNEFLRSLGFPNPGTEGVVSLPVLNLKTLWLKSVHDAESDGGYDSASDDGMLTALAQTLCARNRLLHSEGLGSGQLSVVLQDFHKLSPDEDGVRLLREEVAEVVFLNSDE